MRATELLEDSEPKMPGATGGIQIMTPEEFVAQNAEDTAPEGEEGSLNEVSASRNERYTAVERIEEIVRSRNSVDDYTIEDIKELQKLVKIAGRAVTIHSNGYVQKIGTILDRIIYYHRLNQSKSGSMPQFTGAATTARDLAQQIAIQTNGQARQRYARTWTTGYGQRYKDPSDFVEYETQDDYDSAWEWVESKGKKVYYYDNFKHLNTAIKIGKFIIEPATTIKGAFSDTPETTHAISIRSAKIINQAVRTQADITDQQAIALKDIAATKNQNALQGIKLLLNVLQGQEDIKSVIDNSKKLDPRDKAKLDAIIAGAGNFKEPDQGVTEGDEHLNRIRKLSGLGEATKLAAPTRPIGDPELTDYLDRILNRQKKKTDKYKLPYIHRSSVVSYYNEEGKKYNVDAIKQALKDRPKKLLKQNEKMKHSNGELEQFFNIGFAALVGIALDENTNELIVVNTCPGAGSCKIDCFAMKGGKVQFQGPWLSDGRILTYLLNDPDGFFNQLNNEIQKEEKKGDKGGYTVTIRWHDAGDFFSPEYAQMAFKLAEANPGVMFYAYTKVADVVLADKPANFMINWSEGAHPSQEKQVKKSDAGLEKTKNSRIVPSNLFYDLLVKDEKKNLVKGPEGQWQVIPEKLPELKQRLAKQYNLSPNSILGYEEWDRKTQGGKKETPVQYNVIIAPGEPDITAKSAGVLSTLLLKH